MAREYALPYSLDSPFSDRIQAAGIASLIKCILMLESDLIPPHPSTKAQLNRHFPPLSEKNIRIPQCSVPFLPSSGNGKRRILINNFNATVS